MAKLFHTTLVPCPFFLQEAPRHPEAAPATLDLGPASLEPSPATSSAPAGNATSCQQSRLPRARRSLRFPGLADNETDVFAGTSSAPTHEGRVIHAEGSSGRQHADVTHRLERGEDVLRQHLVGVALLHARTAPSTAERSTGTHRLQRHGMCMIVGNHMSLRVIKVQMKLAQYDVTMEWR